MKSESLKVGIKIHKRKTKRMTNHEDSEHILVIQDLRMCGGEGEGRGRRGWGGG